MRSQRERAGTSFSQPARHSMPGSPEVVRTRPPSVPAASGGAISKVAWVPHEDLAQADWLTAGRRLGAIGRCSQWWIGDWIRYGTARWGEKYVEAAKVTGYDVASLRNMAWVSSRFDLSLRSDKLSWSHHVLLAPLSQEEQRRWIETAVDERLSVADLRLELRARGYGSRGEKAAMSNGSQGRGDDVCPHCGHKLSGPTG
ncbi:MAG: hypothetical protein QOF13_479 [Solirubrobacterales bacterium]|nr:hypothetical protein [Solirubrobacterales bacterium]